jgi:hypothetical protein
VHLTVTALVQARGQALGDADVAAVAALDRCAVRSARRCCGRPGPATTTSRVGSASAWLLRRPNDRGLFVTSKGTDELLRLGLSLD